MALPRWLACCGLAAAAADRLTCRAVAVLPAAAEGDDEWTEAQDVLKWPPVSPGSMSKACGGDRETERHLASVLVRLRETGPTLPFPSRSVLTGGRSKPNRAGGVC